MDIKIHEYKQQNSNNVFWGLNGIPGLARLFHKDTLLDIFPKVTMTRDQKLNTISRLVIYSGILLSFYYSSIDFLLYTIILLIVVYVYYNLGSIDIIRNDNNEGTIQEPLTINYKGYKKNKKRHQDFVSPSKNNPFMNVLPDSYQNKPNCISQIDDSNINYNHIQEDINSKFNEGLFRDISDIYGKASSQRQFYTMPNTSIPNNQEGFAEWLYQTPQTCKEGNGLTCETRMEPRLIGNLYQSC